MITVQEIIDETNKYGGRMFSIIIKDLYTNPNTREFAREIVSQTVQCHICKKVYHRNAFQSGEITCFDNKVACLHHHGVVDALKKDWERSFNNDEWKKLSGVAKYLEKGI